MAVVQTARPSALSAQQKQQIHVEFFFSRLQSIPDWQFKPLPELAKLTKTSVQSFSNRIRTAPDFKHMWIQSAAERRRREWEKKIEKIDFRKLPGWRDLKKGEILRALGVSESALKTAIAKFPVLKKAWRQRRLVKAYPTQGPSLLTRHRLEKIKSIPGWQTMSLGDIAMRIGVARPRIYQMIDQDKAMARLFRSYLGTPSKWSPDNIQAVHARCPSAQEAAKALGVSLDTYRHRLHELGIRRQPHILYLRRPTFAQRLEKVPGWQSKSHEAIARALGVCSGRVCEMFDRHPDLRAQKESQLAPPVLDKILRVPQWQKKGTRRIASLIGISHKTVQSVFRSNPKLAATRRYSAPPWNAARDITAINGWEMKSGVELGRILKRPVRDVLVAIREIEKLRARWRPIRRATPLLAAIMSIPNWKTLEHITLAHIIGAKGQNVYRSLMAYCHRPGSGIDPKTVKALTTMPHLRIREPAEPVRIEPRYRFR